MNHAKNSFSLDWLGSWLTVEDNTPKTDRRWKSLLWWHTERMVTWGRPWSNTSPETPNNYSQREENRSQGHSDWMRLMTWINTKLHYYHKTQYLTGWRYLIRIGELRSVIGEISHFSEPPGTLGPTVNLQSQQTPKQTTWSKRHLWLKGTSVKHKVDKAPQWSLTEGMIELWPKDQWSCKFYK